MKMILETGDEIQKGKYIVPLKLYTIKIMLKKFVLCCLTGENITLGHGRLVTLLLTQEKCNWAE